MYILRQNSFIPPPPQKKMKLIERTILFPSHKMRSPVEASFPSILKYGVEVTYLEDLIAVNTEIQ